MIDRYERMLDAINVIRWVYSDYILQNQTPSPIRPDSQSLTDPQIKPSNCDERTTPSDQARNDSLAITNPILAKLLNIPPSTLQRTRQHSTNLIKQKRSHKDSEETVHNGKVHS
jgi:hypothetical protein